MKNTTKINAATLTGLIAVAFTGFAHAAVAHPGSAGEFPTQTVAYGDLNLDSPQGAQVLSSRVRNAARSVCSSLEGRDLITKAAWQKCYDNAVGSAMSQVRGNAAVALNQVK